MSIKFDCDESTYFVFFFLAFRLNCHTYRKTLYFSNINLFFKLKKKNSFPNRKKIDLKSDIVLSE